jgi:internalin A
MEEEVVTRRWWRGRRFQFSLRALMVVVLVVSVVLAWVVRRALVQRDAVSAIVHGGGSVLYHWEYPGFRTQPDGRIVAGVPMKKGVSPWPKWLMDRLRPDYFGAVTQVHVGPKDPDAVMARVAQLDGLKSLYFNLNVPITDAGFKYVRGMTELKHVAMPIRGSKLTAASLESLKGLTGLRGIYFTNNPPLTDSDLVHLKGLTGLQTLQIPTSPRSAITDAGLANLRNMVDMRELIMNGVKLTSDGLTSLRGMTRLTDLWIAGSRVEDLAPIGNLTGMHVLLISNSPITDAGLAPVAGFTALERLALASTPISDSGLKHLQGLTNLADLDLYKTRVTDAGLPDLTGLTSLQNLTLASTGVTDKGLAHLAGLSSLATLSLYDTGVSDEGLEHLAKLSSLTSLNLGKTLITDAGLKHLAVLKSLTKLNLADTHVTGEGVKRIAGMTSLKELIVKGTAVTDAELDSLRTTLPQLRIAMPLRLAPHR